jgi:hypothetical protein
VRAFQGHDDSRLSGKGSAGTALALGVHQRGDGGKGGQEGGQAGQEGGRRRRQEGGCGSRHRLMRFIFCIFAIGLSGKGRVYGVRARVPGMTGTGYGVSVWAACGLMNGDGGEVHW